MNHLEDKDLADLERYREYLRLIARLELDPRLKRRMDPSDIVQQTMIEACTDLKQFRGQTPEQKAAWLRRILARNLANAARDNRRQRRDVALERSLEASIDSSSVRLRSWLAADQSSPSERAIREEEVLGLADALASLPQEEQDLLILRHWHGWSFAEISRHLGAAPSTMSRLYRRALGQLRGKLKSLG
jgi:RNA polymerase sigma-70 factor (ECF subfamily)